MIQWTKCAQLSECANAGRLGSLLRWHRAQSHVARVMLSKISDTKVVPNARESSIADVTRGSVASLGGLSLLLFSYCIVFIILRRPIHMESVARASTAGSRRYSRGAANVSFDLTPEQLGTLHNPKNLGLFCKLGGIDGLLKGLRTDRYGGLGVRPATLTAGQHAEPIEAVSGPSTRTTASSSATLPEKSPSAGKAQITRVATGGSRDPALLHQRTVVFGDNRLPTRKQPGFLHLVWGAYNDPVLFLLTVAAAISLAIGLYQTFTSQHSNDNPAVEWVEGVAILVAVVVIVLVGSVNDWEKQRQFRKLNEKQLERDAKVVRSGELRLMPGSGILVGDIVQLEPGDLVPADGILLEGHNVACDESSATGESDLVHKTPGGDAFRAVAQGNRAPDLELVAKLDPFMLSGTRLMDGTGTFLVTATGIRSTYGRNLASLSDESDPTPLQARLAVLAKQIAWIGGVLAGLLFIALLIRFLVAIPHDTRPSTEKGKNFIDILIISLTVLVIAVPEGLPLAVTLSLAYATTRMLKDHNLVRQLKACETMGNATNICSDKTGTLTQNKMAVITGALEQGLEFRDTADASTESKMPSPLDIISNLAPEFKILLYQSIAINSTAFEGENQTFVGSNTESALLSFAKKYLELGSVATERSKHKIVQLIPFNASRQCMVSVIELPESPGTCRVFVKGAPEVLLSMSNRVTLDPSLGTNTADMSLEQRDWITNVIKNYGGQALRTIGLFYRDVQVSSVDGSSTLESELDQRHLLKELVFLGVFGIHDSLRPGVPEAVRTCQHAGVTVRMVTGDNLLTARAIASQCGILGTDPDDVALEGAEFRALSDEELRDIAPRLKVLARSSPDDKQRLVVCLKAMGEIVAVTGDGTNDASAMSAADVSFSMGGLSGTEVAREASSIVLLTDDFTSIVKAIMWGRAVNDSVKKFLQVRNITTWHIRIS